MQTSDAVRAQSGRWILVGSLLPLLCIALVWLNEAKASAAPSTSATINACGATIDVRFAGETTMASRGDLLTWVQRAGDAVCTYYGKFPVSHLALEVNVRGSAGVHSGTTYPDRGGYIRTSLGKETTAVQLKEDWMLTHEMIHLAFPSMADRHHWIEEGLSVYVEPIARVQAGQLTAEEMWHDVVRDIPQGQPQPGDRGLDGTHTWGRTYWGGALFSLVADVRIRQQTHNHKGLQDALRALLAAGGDITEDWPIERALTVGDKATGTTVLAGLYQEMRDQPSPVDLAALWKALGVERGAGGSIRFDSAAPLANIREGITRPKAAATQDQP